MKTPKILTFDLETAPYKFWGWGPGQQYVSHKQLVDGHNEPEIICAAWCWNDGKHAKSIDWGYEEQDSSRVVEEIDKQIRKADVVIGKNNTRFDNKVLNAVRMLQGLPGMPEWTKYTDDLETQMRKYFRLPSQSLDYISHRLGLGGKIKMEMQDWIDIVEKNNNGLVALRKMIKYNKKDVEDTRTLWDKLAEHFETRFNVAVHNNLEIACKNCGGENIFEGGTKTSGAGHYRQWYCNDCKNVNGGPRYAGRTLISSVTGKNGKIR